MKGKFNVHKCNQFLFYMLAGVLTTYSFRHEEYYVLVGAALAIAVAVYASIAVEQVRTP